jgi:hypothetical protein
MPAKRSLYRKIQEVLDSAKSVRAASRADLVQAITDSNNEIFHTLQYNARLDKFEPGISKRVVKQTVATCILLDLISGDGRLTDTGSSALRKAHFEGIVAKQIRAHLSFQGLDVEKLNRVIAKNLRAEPPVMPTCAVLWEAYGESIPYGRFARLLTLLAHCGGAQSSQRKIYLHIAA